MCQSTCTIRPFFGGPLHGRNLRGSDLCWLGWVKSQNPRHDVPSDLTYCMYTSFLETRDSWQPHLCRNTHSNRGTVTTKFWWGGLLIRPRWSPQGSTPVLVL
jgi:hypothetical protein